MRLIDADTIFNGELLLVSDKAYDAVHAVIERINNAPTVDSVPVVRCKDCKNYGTDGNRLNCNVFCCSMPKEGFCSMGERREDETD